MQIEEKKKSFFSRFFSRFLAIFHRHPPPLPPHVGDDEPNQSPSPHTMCEQKNSIPDVGQSPDQNQEPKNEEKDDEKKKGKEQPNKPTYSTLPSLPETDTLIDMEEKTGCDQVKSGGIKTSDSKTGLSKTETSPYIDLSAMGSAGSYSSDKKEVNAVQAKTPIVKEEKRKMKRKPVATPTTPLQLVRVSPEKCRATPKHPVSIPTTTATPSPTQPSPAKNAASIPSKSPSPSPKKCRAKATVNNNKPKPSPKSKTHRGKTPEVCGTPKTEKTSEKKLGKSRKKK